MYFAQMLPDGEQPPRKLHGQPFTPKASFRQSGNQKHIKTMTSKISSTQTRMTALFTCMNSMARCSLLHLIRAFIYIYRIREKAGGASPRQHGQSASRSSYYKNGKYIRNEDGIHPDSKAQRRSKAWTKKRWTYSAS
jgi:hypothetical protein